MAVLLVLVVVASGLLLGRATPTWAAPPTALTPSGGVAVAGTPNLTWTRAGVASRYDVQVASGSGFASTLVSTQTSNSSYTPTVALPQGLISWRVRTAGEGDGAWVVATFESVATAAPTATGPADGALLSQPDTPPLLSWTDVSGARGYRVRISTDRNFTDPSKFRTYATDGARNFSLPDLQIPDLYYWQVQADLGSGIVTDWSPARSYRVVGLARPELVSPADDATTSVVDVVLDWRPVSGAASYDLQISTDANFLDGTIVRAENNIQGTRYSPPATLNNDQYFWRVRPVDASGNRRSFTDVSTWKFRRHWPSQPRLVHPADQTTVGDPFYYQWSAVDHASSYVVQMSSDPGFTTGTTSSCTTTATTLARGDNRRAQGCFPLAQSLVYWRVMARDEFPNVGGTPVTAVINAEVHSFTYDPSGPGRVDLRSPSPGATVQVPTLTWSPVAGSARYKVVITNTANGQSTGGDTAATTYTPESLSPGTYRWDVRTTSSDGRVGAALLPESQPRFVVASLAPGTAATPEPDPVAAGHRFPTLTWSPVANATSYKVRVRARGAIAWTDMPGTWRFPAADDRSTTFLPARTYEWYVEADRADGSVIAAGSTGTFTITPLPQVDQTTYWAALSGTTLTGDLGTPIDRCSNELPNACSNLRQTPVLGWTNPDPDVGYYELYLSRDAELTNVLPGYPVTVASNDIWTDTEQLPDSQAGSAYFWQLRPCLVDGVCAPLRAATHAFAKKSRQATLISPAEGEKVADDVTLTWDDYLVSERRPDEPVGPDPDTGTPLSTPATLEARSYRVQTATDPNFQNIIESVDVDQTTFTSFGTTYPEGPVYWRVQAYDGSSNALALSNSSPLLPPRMFQKTSPAPRPTSPSPGEVIRGDQPLQWTPLDFAASYQVEIYRNDDRVGSPANRVGSYSTKQVVLTLSAPLEVSDAAYTWRVRRLDGRGREGAWSILQPFVVTGPAPSLASPVPSAQVDPVDSLFAWQKLDRATSYRFERRPAGSSTSESTTTAATSWAPTDPLGGGSWEWRVTALDSSGRSMGQASWRPFTVVDTVAAVVPVQISGNGKVGSQLTVQPSTPAWNLSQVVTTYQWRRNGSDIQGATGPSYVLTAADNGREVTVAATGATTRPGYRNGTSISNAVRATTGEALTPYASPRITGSATVRGTLTADPGSWPGAPGFTYAWTRDGVDISGGDRRDHTVVPADAGHQLAVRVTASSSGYDPGTATSASVVVAKQTSTTTVTTGATKLVGRARTSLTVTLSVDDVGDPLGSVRIHDGSKVLLTTALKPGGRGQVVVKLPKLKKGKHTLRAEYLGNSATAGSSSGTVKIKVVAGKKK